MQEESKKKMKKHTKKKKKRKVLRVFKLIFCVTLVLALIVGIGVLIKFGPIVKKYQDEAKTLVRSSSEKDFKESNTSYIYDANGSQLAKLRTEKDVSYLEFEDLPDEVLDAFIAIEDKRFYSHKGVDWLSTAKAGFLLLSKSGDVTRGGSTITQQLARNKYLSFEVSYERKIREIFFALELERKYSKKQIFEYYVNNINFSNGYYGIGAAAKGYFGKEVEELTLAEVTFLCAIPNNPTFFNPRNKFNNTVKRQNVILDQMNEQGFIRQSEYTTAKTESIELVEPVNTFYNYESSYAIACGVKYLMEDAGFTFRYDFMSMSDYSSYMELYNEAYSDAKEQLYTGGYKIYTSIVDDVQDKLQESVDEVMERFPELTDDGIYKYQAASTVIDNETGKVIAIVGGRTQETEGVMTLNRAFQSYKQPGSTIKPLIVYAPALENGYSDNSTVDDSRIEDGPKNVDGKYSGKMSLRKAVERSKNVVAWRLFEELTPTKGLSYIQKMQFDRIVPDDYYLPASLGGLTYGVNTVQMASGFNALANDGNYKEPTCIVKFIDANGEDIYREKETISIYTQDSSRVLTDILQGVALEGTARGLNLSNNMPLACKTGTTNEQTCGWFCGYTPYYSVSVYVGADTNTPLDGLWGGTYPKEIWQSIQEYLNQDKEVIPFKTSENIHQYSEPTHTDPVVEEEPIQEEEILEEITIEETNEPGEEEEEERETSKPGNEDEEEEEETDEPGEETGEPGEGGTGEPGEEPPPDEPDENEGGVETPPVNAEVTTENENESESSD